MSETEKLDRLLFAARRIRELRDRQNARVKFIQGLAAEARRTGVSQAHRVSEAPKVTDYGDAIEDLIAAVARFDPKKRRTAKAEP